HTRRNAGTAETSSVPDLDDEGEPCERDCECGPDATANGLVKDEARPECDEDRCDVLDQQRDSDVQPVNRKEVGPLNDGESDAESDQEREVAGLDSQRSWAC